MSGFEIFLLVMLLYWSDAITYPIREGYREIKHRIDMASIVKEAEKLKKARESGMTTEDMVEAGLLHKGSDVMDTFDKWREEKSNRKLPEWFHNTIWHIKSKLWYKLLEHPEDLRYWLIHLIQRAKRGWSNRDTWCFTYFLASVIIGGLEHLKKTKHGVPNAFCTKNAHHDDEEFEKCCANWDKALDSMILTFKISQKICNDSWRYQNSKTYSIKDANMWRKWDREWRKKDPDLYRENENHVMTKKECQIYEKGWALFQEHFFSLWD
jgi:hypothetical protein